jgi:hypothetical protein
MPAIASRRAATRGLTPARPASWRAVSRGDEAAAPVTSLDDAPPADASPGWHSLLGRNRPRRMHKPPGYLVLDDK